MISIKTLAEGLSRQLESALAGKADARQADVVCKSVDSIIKLARLQIELCEIDWAASDEKPLIEMEPNLKAIASPPPIVMDKFKPTADSVKGQQIERNLFDARQQLLKATPTMQKILNDKIKHLEISLARAESQSDDNDP